MADATRLLGAFGVALALALIATPAAIRIARRIDFLDRPRGYKQHLADTPYLGGAAVMLAVLAALVPFARELDGLAALIACALGLLALGTLDDRVGLPVWPRLLAQVGSAIALYAAGFGWEPGETGSANLILTVALFVGVINAYNLMDNLDGAAATIALVSGAALAVYCAAEGAPLLGAVGAAVAGACAGFLPFNLSRPSARIFLGDGGSMPIGMLIAAVIANLPGADRLGWELVGVCVVLVGLPALDTIIVTLSRRRRGVPLLEGARDHLTHRMLVVLGSPRSVAGALAGAQALCVLAGILLLVSSR